jgi:hypothetical protein
VTNAVGNVKPKPSLPPRLPPRRDSGTLRQDGPVSPPSYGSALQTRPPPPASPSPWNSGTQARPTPAALLNQGALHRLGSAGVSVPGFGIGTQSQSEEPNPWAEEHSTSPKPSSTSSSGFNSPQGTGMSDLQSRFSKFSTSSSTPADAPSQGTSFAEKKAAIKTAHAFRNDPSSVTLADGKATASTINNFRQRHGEQVAKGWQGANGLNRKYGIADKISGMHGSATGGLDGQSAQELPASPEPAELPATPVPAVKKAAPPPPPKRMGAGGAREVGSPPPPPPPPPVPLGSKPR